MLILCIISLLSNCYLTIISLLSYYYSTYYLYLLYAIICFNTIIRYYLTYYTLLSQIRYIILIILGVVRQVCKCIRAPIRDMCKVRWLQIVQHKHMCFLDMHDGVQYGHRATASADSALLCSLFQLLCSLFLLAEQESAGRNRQKCTAARCTTIPSAMPS